MSQFLILLEQFPEEFEMWIANDFTFNKMDLYFNELIRTYQDFYTEEFDSFLYHCMSQGY